MHADCWHGLKFVSFTESFKKAPGGISNIFKWGNVIWSSMNRTGEAAFHTSLSLLGYTSPQHHPRFWEDAVYYVSNNTVSLHESNRTIKQDDLAPHHREDTAEVQMFGLLPVIQPFSNNWRYLAQLAVHIWVQQPVPVTHPCTWSKGSF